MNATTLLHNGNDAALPQMLDGAEERVVVRRENETRHLTAQNAAKELPYIPALRPHKRWHSWANNPMSPNMGHVRCSGGLQE